MITPTTPITVEVPVAQPPVMEEKTFDQLRILRLTIDSPDNTKCTVTTQLQPFNSVTGEVAPFDKIVRLLPVNVFTPEKFTPSIQAAMAALLAAVEEEAKAQNKI